MLKLFRKIREWIDGVFVDELCEPSPPEKVYYVNVYFDMNTGGFTEGLRQPTRERAKMQAEKLRGTGLVLALTKRVKEAVK